MDIEDKNQPTGSPVGQVGGAPEPPKPPAEKAGGGFKGLRVSLMPAEEGEGRPNLQKRLMALGLVVVLETLIIGGVYFAIVQRTEANIFKREALMEKVETLDVQIRQQEATAEELSAFNVQVKIIGETLDRHLYWSGFMDFLEKNTKPSVRYERFTGTSGSGVITLDATALTYADMAEQVMLFENHPMVRNVRADSAATSVDEVGNIAGVSWVMTLAIDTDLWHEAPVKTSEEDGSAEDENE